ncbi:hypothetical protein CLAFUW4_14011 [Fulvia fulva]|nr:hypothetical protein CLAFUR4_14014 [Fulvia fulva]KAK4611461.1 hypothetical protein CLAFUR0_14018 [Fulvia fulva]WPV22317.1 hypothetical protein CLAFUW4_14011 [Fulvia fulva]
MVLKHEEASEDSALSSAFQHYNRLIVDEHRVRNGAIVRARLKALFLACPNLTKLSFNMKDILHPNKAFEHPEWLCGLRVPHGAFDSGPHVFGQALLAAYDASLDLRDLSVGIVSSIPMKDVDTTLTLAAIKNLTRLHWKCEDPDSIDEDLRGNDDPALHQSVGGIQDSHLATRLSNCPRLETLLLDLSYRSSASSRVDLRLLFPHASVLRHLRRVRMTNFQATPERLSSFLLNHALTLQYLHLHNVHLYEHDEGEQWREQPDENGIFWQTCIEAFAGNLTHLKEVRLTGRFTSHASNGLWYYGRKSRSCSGEDGYERSSSEVIDYILTSTCQYYFPAPSFDVDLARMTPMWDPEDDDTWGLSSSSSGEDDATEDDDDVSESDESDSEDEEA